MLAKCGGALAAAVILWTSLAQLAADGPKKPLLPDDPVEAWTIVQEGLGSLQAPDAWQTNEPTADKVEAFQKTVSQRAADYAAKAREFAERFPTSEYAGDARITVVFLLTHAVAAGDPGAEQQINDYIASVLADKSISEDNRVTVLLYGGNVPCFKKLGIRVFTEGMGAHFDELESAMLDALHSAQKQFPNNAFLYTMMIAIAERSTGERKTALANEILAASGSSPGAKSFARHLLNGTKPYEVGKPLEIKFTALDGREVDLAKMKGKVVLVNFWSTECGPCIGELPHLKEIYEKFHNFGFEIVAISLDDKENALREFIDERKIPWPQQFDGNGWGNSYAVQYGVFSIPTMWLIDKAGNLRDTDPRFDLENRITPLLAE